MTFSLPTASTDRIKRTDNPVQQAELLRQGWIQDNEPTYDPATQHPPVRENRAWVIPDKTEAELAEAIALAARKIWENSGKFVENILQVAPAAIAAAWLSTDSQIVTIRAILQTWAGEVWSDDERVQQAFSLLKANSILTEEQVTAICTK